MRLITLAFASMIASAAAAQERVAFFGMTLLDASLQTATEGHEAEDTRLRMIEAMVRDRFEAEGYILLDLAPVQQDLDRVVNPAKCYGCDTRMASKLGADYALVGEVQKVSNLILTMNLQMRDASTGEMVKGRVIDLRGNTDDTWTRAMRSILNNTFFRREEK